MTLQAVPFTTAHEAELRARLAARIRTFPRRLRIEQIKSQIKYTAATFSYIASLFGAALLAVYLLRSILNIISLSIPGFEFFSVIAPSAFVFWSCSWRSSQRIGRLLRTFFGIRTNLLHRRDQAPILAALNSSTKIGLHLRAFVDEDVLYPSSRDQVPRALKSVDKIFFASASNPRHDRFASDLFVLEIPFSDWKATIFELMQISSVIVIDTNAGHFDWMYPLGDIRNERAMTVEFRRRKGFLEELREISTKQLFDKIVAVVPPGWEEWRHSGEIEQQISMEDQAVSILKDSDDPAVRLLTPKIGGFARTELKRILLQVPITVVSEDALRIAVEQMLSKNPDE